MPHIMNGAFSVLSLSLPSPWLRLGRMYTQDIKLLVFIAQDGPHPSKTLAKCSLLLSASLAGSAAMSALGAILDPSSVVLRHLGGILVASWWHLRPIFDRPEASWWYLGRTVEY